MVRKTNILICPLEWGLGHASRMIPVAKRLQEMNCNIFIGSGKTHLDLLRTELKDVTLIDFSGFKPVYSRHLPQYLVMLIKSPLLLYHIIAEHLLIKKIIRKNSIDIIISDNRFGLWNKSITSVYVTHMPLIPMPKQLWFLEFIGILLHRYIIRKYSLCLIPDLPGDLNLSGRLSHGVKLPENVRFAGILSKFAYGIESPDFSIPESVYNTVILSGPEPQRGMLKKILAQALAEKTTSTVFLEGKPGEENEIVRSGKIIYYSHLDAAEMRKLLSGSQNIICRSGYTTIMDLIALNCTALLIPTPGQTEQEYLAEYLSGKGLFLSLTQKTLSENIELTAKKPVWPPSIISESKKLLNEVLTELLENHKKKNQPEKPCQ